MNFDVPYAITRRLPGVSMDAARNRVEAAVKAEGVGGLTEIDVEATLKKKSWASRALLLFPCNVVLAADGEELVIAAATPTSMFGVCQGPADLIASGSADLIGGAARIASVRSAVHVRAGRPDPHATLTLVGRRRATPRPHPMQTNELL